MRIFLPCWGDKHITLLEHCLLKSLSWKSNREAIKGAEWLVTTNTKSEADKIKQTIYDVDGSAKIFAVASDEVKNPGPFLLSVLKHAIDMCLNDKSPMLMATPDYIYGDGTIKALRELGKEKGSVIGLAHMRVTPKILKYLYQITEFGISNEQLVTLGLQHAHQAWKLSDEGLKEGVSYFGGISWKDVSGDYKVIAVKHRLPAPFFANFEKSDLEFFNNTHSSPHDHTFALWDHLFQSHLLNENRFRYIGSSDLALMLEVTEDEANIPPLNPPDKTNADDYCNRWFHNDMCKQFITVFRGL